MYTSFIKIAIRIALKFKLEFSEKHSTLGPGLEDEGGHGAEENGGGDACGGVGEAAGEGAHEADLLHGALHARGQRMTEAGQGDGRARACKISHRPVQPNGAENDARDDVSDKDARRSCLLYTSPSPRD